MHGLDPPHARGEGDGGHSISLAAPIVAGEGVRVTLQGEAPYKVCGQQAVQYRAVWRLFWGFFYRAPRAYHTSSLHTHRDLNPNPKTCTRLSGPRKASAYIFDAVAGWHLTADARKHNSTQFDKCAQYPNATPTQTHRA